MDDNCALCALHRHHRRPQSPSPSTSITFHLPLHFIQGAKATVTQRSATRSDLNHGGFRSRLHRERDNMQKSEFLKALSDMWKDFDSRVLRYKIELDFFDTASSSTASLVSCSNPICASVVQAAAAECSSQSNQCDDSFQYGDGNGTSGYY